MAEITIEKVKDSEWLSLQDIARETFVETFAHQNDPQSMQQYLYEKFSEAQIQQELANPASQFYFVRYLGDVVGYLKLNIGNAQTEVQQELAMEIERIYVLGKCQGKKLGQALLQHAFSQAELEGVNYLWLGVWEQNHQAIGFYERHGFEVFGQHVFQLGTEQQIDLMMRCSL